MEKRILQGLMITLGLAAIGIGLMIFVLGGGNTGHLTELTFNYLTGANQSEMRFYAPFWITYGGLLIYVARDLSRHATWMPLLCGVFFAGGAGRVIAYFTAGPPHPAFTVLMAIELVLPVVFVALWVRVRARLTDSHTAD
jgi:hypothetical protein